MEPLAKRILLIEDEAADAMLFRRHVEQGNSQIQFNVTHLDRAEAAKDSDLDEFDIVVMDMNLPGLSGMDAVRFMQEKAPALPIVILSGNDDEMQAMQAAGLGVQDYLVKGVHGKDVICRTIRYAIERKHYEDKIAYLMHHDQLTGLMNGELFQSMLSLALSRVRSRNRNLAVYCINLDNFKDINTVYGTHTGNGVLVEAGKVLRSMLREDSLIARMNADEFVVAVEVDEGLDTCGALAECIGASLTRNFDVCGHTVSISASVGIATFPQCGSTSPELLKHARAALLTAKTRGRGEYRFFTQELNEKALQRIRITRALREAVGEKDFLLHYHPKIDLRTGKVIGAEALIRWTHPTLGFISPEIFIPLAEESGLIDDITEWVCETACLHHKKMAVNNFDMAINISARQLTGRTFIDTLSKIIRRTGIKPHNLVLEITETAVMADAQHALSLLSEMKELGVKLHIDDFGTGYSSLNYLRRFPVDALKIDRSFVMEMHRNEEDAKIVKLVIDLAHDLGKKVVAEGVELEEHANMLKLMGCDIAQGYLYSMPLSSYEFTHWLQEYRMVG